MRYIINNNIKYHEDRSELVSLHDDIPPITLTATLNRLLSALVRNNNLVLSRDALLAQVWEAHGQVASGNNLNNTISILRKMFATLGEDDIIVTLPRQGFMFRASQLKTADSQVKGPVEPVEPAELAEPVEPSESDTSPALIPHMPRLKRYALMVLIALAIGSGIWAWLATGYPPLRVANVGKIDNCEVQFVTSYHKTGPSEIDRQHFQEMLKKNNHVQCHEPATLLYFDSQAILPNTTGKVRIAYLYYCPQAKMAAGKVQCENFYESWGL
ncbi:winged helix-turn-helix domain-containing protein [Serratia marcescens]|uniref:winged helix-turn-helix domain-containing protein n=1 Tax=Serratia marcescens TaxID=615 RepID=UPI003F7D3833